jgi:hypothetical protein
MASTSALVGLGLEAGTRAGDFCPVDVNNCVPSNQFGPEFLNRAAS